MIMCVLVCDLVFSFLSPFQREAFASILRNVYTHTHTQQQTDNKTHEVVFLGSPAMRFTLQTVHCNLTRSSNCWWNGIYLEATVFHLVPYKCWKKNSACQQLLVSLQSLQCIQCQMRIKKQKNKQLAQSHYTPTIWYAVSWIYTQLFWNLEQLNFIGGGICSET